MAVHDLKSWPEMFGPVLDGTKTFELRRNDRDFHTGDHIVLREYDPNTDSYSGREIVKRITYVLRGIGNVGSIAPFKGLSMGYAILALADVEQKNEPPAMAQGDAG